MSNPSAQPPDGDSSDVAGGSALAAEMHLDTICDQFEAVWKSGKRPLLTEYVLRVSPELRSQLVRELLIVELAYRTKAGETPSLDDYSHLAATAEHAVNAAFRSARLAVGDLGPVSTSPSSVGQVQSGSRLSQYDLLEKIGAGAMGEVFKARHRHMHRIVALKVMNPALIRDARSIERFQREIETIGGLSHANIVTAHDAGEDQGVHFFVMEYVEGLNLAALVRRNGPLSVSQSLACLRQSALGAR